MSWKTSQYGLAIDNVLAFELVKPDSTAVNVTAESDPELFFGLKVSHANVRSVPGKSLRLRVKGGLNNFVSARRVRDYDLYYDYYLTR